MTIPSDKPTKKCKYCGKEVKNLGFHVANNHPAIMEQLEEISPQPQAAPIIQPKTQALPAADTNEMVRQKLETMLNIKLIQMLEKGASIEEVNRMLHPPPPVQTFGLKELKDYHDLVFKGQNPAPTGEEASSGFDWTALINGVVQILPALLAKRNNTEVLKNGFDTGEFEERSNGILKPISAQIAGDTTEPRDIGTEPINIGETEQSDISINSDVNKGT